MCLVQELGTSSSSSIASSPTLTATTSTSSWPTTTTTSSRATEKTQRLRPASPTESPVPNDLLPHLDTRKQHTRTLHVAIDNTGSHRHRTTDHPHRMYNLEGSRMGERRRSPGIDSQQTAASTSTYVRGPPQPQRSTTLSDPTRHNTPPASSYFLTTQGGDNSEPQPIVADAGSHFAYSTTLRRPHYELTSPTAIQNITHGDWQGALDSFSRGTSSGPSLDHPRLNGVPHPSKGPGTQQNAPETPSSKFSYSTIEV